MEQVKLEKPPAMSKRPNFINIKRAKLFFQQCLEANANNTFPKVEKLDKENEEMSDFSRLLTFPLKNRQANVLNIDPSSSRKGASISAASFYGKDVKSVKASTPGNVTFKDLIKRDYVKKEAELPQSSSPCKDGLDVKAEMPKAPDKTDSNKEEENICASLGFKFLEGKPFIALDNVLSYEPQLWKELMESVESNNMVLSEEATHISIEFVKHVVQKSQSAAKSDLRETVVKLHLSSIAPFEDSEPKAEGPRYTALRKFPQDFRPNIQSINPVCKKRAFPFAISNLDASPEDPFEGWMCAKVRLLRKLVGDSPPKRRVKSDPLKLRFVPQGLDTIVDLEQGKKGKKQSFVQSGERAAMQNSPFCKKAEKPPPKLTIPPGWGKFVDAKTNQVRYFNCRSGQSFPSLRDVAAFVTHEKVKSSAKTLFASR
jgi:hypothetical protein